MKKLVAKLGAFTAVVAALAFAVCLSACGGSNGGYTVNVGGQDYTFDLVKEGTLVCAMSPDYPPFENLEGEEPVGCEVEIGQKIAEILGLNYEWTGMDFDGIITAIQAGGQADVGTSGFSVTPERQEVIDFTTSYYTDDMAVAVLKDSTLANQHDMNRDGLKIAVQQGTTGEAWAKENFPNAQIVPFKQVTDVMAAVQAGKADAVCNNRAVVADQLATGFDNFKIIVSVATDEDYAFVISKDNPDLTEAINAAYAQLDADGTIHEILVKYGLAD